MLLFSLLSNMLFEVPGSRNGGRFGAHSWMVLNLKERHSPKELFEGELMRDTTFGVIAPSLMVRNIVFSKERKSDTN